VLDCTLTNKHKYLIVKNYVAAKGLDVVLLKKAFENDESDEGKKAQMVCRFIIPDTKMKESLWAGIVDEESTCSLLEAKMKMEGFW
jgi:hypothetical protein